MGKYKGKAENRQNRWDTTVDKKDLKPNEKWIAYYKAQHIVKDEGDWNEMVSAFMLPLPASLRINFDCPYADRLKEELLQFCSPSESSETGAVKALSWFPDGRAFQLELDRTTIRKSQDEGLKRLHQWLIVHTETGMLTRQEAVSMIPPCVLQVEPHHLTLDMCASPGSKTTQILEVIQNAVKGCEEPQGMVVANDCDTQRAYMLAHQCKRIHSPALVITTHLGQNLPSLKSKGDRNTGLFDRVLADVPCSGDGTIRKQPSIMASWGCHGGAALHPLQLDIALRGANLCKVGGLLVYSTCSMNPVENEAVIAALLIKANGALVIEDTSNIIPQLKRRPGLSSWRVFEEGMKPDSRQARKMAEKKERKAAARAEAGEPPLEEEVVAEVPVETDADLLACTAAGLRHLKCWDDVSEVSKGRIRKGMFPPAEGTTLPNRAPDGSFLDGTVPLNLERCMRCVPHDENTGGFFVTCLRKVCELDMLEEKQQGKSKAAAAEGGEESAAKRARVGDKESSDKPAQNYHSEFYRPVSSEMVTDVKKFFGINDSFPFDQLFTRNEGTAKTVTYVTKTVKENILDGGKQDRLKIVLTGLKMFEKNSANNVCESKYRLVQECARIVEPFMDDSRKVIFPPAELAKLVNRDVQQHGGIISVEGFEVANKIKELEAGAFLAITPTENGEDKIVVVCWRGRNDNNINVMCSKEVLHVVGQRLLDMGVEVVFAAPPVKNPRPEAASEDTTTGEKPAAE